MAEAPLGDDVFGEDPTVNRLEEYVAELLGKEAAIYAPSGTMTNQIGVHVNTGRAEEVLIHEGSHVFVYEGGAPALLSGVQMRTLPGEGGVLDPETIRAAIRPENVHFPRSRLPLKHPQHRRWRGLPARRLCRRGRCCQGTRPRGPPRRRQAF